jgi:flagellar hook-basal body complex protein FliE
MDYASAISKVVPGTFVPDLGAASGADETPAIGAIPGGAAARAGPSFKDTLKHVLEDVNDKLTVSERNARDLADGRTNDLEKVVTSAEEANLALSYTIAMRDKLMEAYQQVSNMQI